MLHGILYHKLSTIMLTNRGTGCFKAYFQIFVHLEIFFIMTRVPYMVRINTGFGQYLSYQLEFL